MNFKDAAKAMLDGHKVKDEDGDTWIFEDGYFKFDRGDGDFVRANITDEDAANFEWTLVPRRVEFETVIGPCSFFDHPESLEI